MKHYQCENCGAELVKNGDEYVCEYCKRTYADDSLEKAYYKVCQTLQTTVQGVVSEEFLRSKIEKIATCRQGLYKARTGEYIDNDDIHDWAKSILKLLPDDPQANFYEIASSERWTELNKFLSKFDVKENGYLLDGFVDYLTNGRLVEKCVLRLNDLISRAFPENSAEYKSCHKKIVEATEKHNSGTFDAGLPRDVFVAYSSKDSEKAYSIVEYLEERGLNCFISMRNLPKGVDAEKYYEKRLKQAIDNCQVFLFVSSHNSRSRSCDAYSLEIAYVKECDLRASGNINYYNSNYDLYLEKCREKCKPRVEWLIDNYGNSIYETEVKKFFKGLSWCVDEESVLSSIADYITNNPMAAAAQANDEFARQKEEFAKQKAEFERQCAELEKLKAERERQNADVLARQQAEIERQKAESERQQLEFEKQKMEIERQKLEFEKQKMEIERQKAALANAKPVETPVQLTPAAPPVVGITLHNELYDIDNGVLTKYKGSKMFASVPEGTITIESYAFNGNDTLYTISLPDSVRTIKSYAINNCKTLVSAGIPKFVEKIEAYAFSKCSPKFTAFVEATSQPSGWDSAWGAQCPEIKWGAKVNPEKRKQEGTTVQPTAPVQKPVKGITLNNAEFEIENGVLKKYKGSEWIIFVPEGTLEVASYAFNNQEFYTVSLPPTVKTVRRRAFYNCGKMVSVELPSSVTEIEEDAFYGCSPKFGVYAQAMEVPRGWKYGWNNGCANVKMGARVSKPLKDTPDEPPKTQEKPVITPMPKTTTTAKPKATKTAKTKTTTTAKPTEQTPVVVNGFEIENGVLKKYRGAEKDVVIPDTVKEIGERAFANCTNLINVKIPDGVKTIGMQAFAGCENLGDVVIPASVTDIGGNAFMYCTKSNLFSPLKEKPQGWKIGTKPVVWEYGKTEEKSETPLNGEFKIKNGVLTIENNVLKKYVGKGGEVIIPDGVIEIGNSAFANCPITNIKIPVSVKRIGNSAFFNTSLTTLQIPNGVVRIEERAFAACRELKSIEIPASVTFISNDAFIYSRKLTIYTLLKGKPLDWSSNWNKLENVGDVKCPVVWGKPMPKLKTEENPIEPLKESSAQKQEFSEKQAAAWNNSLKNTETKPVEIKQPSFTDKGLESSVKNANKLLAQAKKDTQKTDKSADFQIENGTLIKYKGKDSFVEIPSTVKVIGAYAFQNCTSVKNVKLPLHLTSIYPNAFENSGLTTIPDVPDSLRTIGNYAFKDCKYLTSVNLQCKKLIGSVRLIGNGAFENCTELETVQIPYWLNELGSDAFKNCKKLMYVYLPEKLEKIGANAFAGCTKLTIKTNLTKKPKGWVQPLFGKGSWNPDKRPVQWDYIKSLKTKK